MQNDLDIGIYFPQTRSRLFQLRFSDIVRPIKNLPLQVRGIDPIGIDQPERADSRRRQIKRCRRPQAARADAQHSRRFDSALAFDIHFRQNEMTRVASQVSARQGDFRHSLFVDDAHALRLHERPIDAHDSLAFEAF